MMVAYRRWLFFAVVGPAVFSAAIIGADLVSVSDGAGTGPRQCTEQGVANSTL
jgi:hypothetical protein